MEDGAHTRAWRTVARAVAGGDALASGEAVVAMVSGGADSTFLMHALAGLHDGPVHVLTVDHGLRPEARGECDAVAEAARGLGLGIHVARLGLAPGAGLQERAREARYAAARRHAARVGATAIATGHTADDLAETVLMRLARGAGTDGLRGIVPRRRDLARPMLGVRRDEARAWCDGRGLEPVDDPSNSDPAYARVRARELLHDLEAVSPGAAVHLRNLAFQATDEREALEPVLDAARERLARGGGWDAAGLVQAHPAVQRILLRELLRLAGAGADALSHSAVESIRGGLPHVGVRDVAGGIRVGTLAGVLRAWPAGDAPLVPAGPGEVLRPGGSVRVGRTRVSAVWGTAQPPTGRRICVPPDRPLTVRAAAPGDRVALDGGGRARVGRVLAGSGVPFDARGGVPVVLAGDELVWVVGHRWASAKLATGPGTAIVLEMEDE